jgi:SAM-dependent methyltransferase
LIRLNADTVELSHREKLMDDIWRNDDNICHREELAKRWLNGGGIEIGGLHRPTAVRPNTRVRYVDYKTKQQNLVRYPELAGQQIVETDIVDDGFSLSKLPDYSEDFVIANHALEHSPDPLGTLKVWSSKIKRGGKIYFAVPIGEKCYDHGRAVTTLEHIRSDHSAFLSGDITTIARETEDHLREFATISGGNILKSMHLEPDGSDKIEALVSSLMPPLLADLRRASLTPSAKDRHAELIAAHVRGINFVYDIHYHVFSPTSVSTLAEVFSSENGCRLLECRKSGGGECIVVLEHL